MAVFKTTIEICAKILGRILFVALIVITSLLFIFMYYLFQSYPEVEPLGDDYVFIDDHGKSQIALYVSEDMSSYRSNDKYIIGRGRLYIRDLNDLSPALAQIYKETKNPNERLFWVIDMINEEEYGPLRNDDFEHLKDSLGVNLDFD